MARRMPKLVKLLAKALGVPKRRISVVSGESSRRKIVEIAGVDLGDILRRLPRPNSNA
ncbi:MAG: DUF167 domain-containing protein [Verrucomicrobiota bacterium]